MEIAFEENDSSAALFTSHILDDLDFEPSKDRLPVYYDDRGMIDLDSTVNSVISTFNLEDQQWLNHKNLHHFYYTKHDFDVLSANYDSDYTAFRNSPWNVGRIPVDFHALLHQILEKPVVPELEVVKYHVQASNVALELFKNTYWREYWEKEKQRRELLVGVNPQIIANNGYDYDVFGQEIISQNLQKFESGVSKASILMETIPPEFRIIDPEYPADRIIEIGNRVAKPKNDRRTIRKVGYNVLELLAA